MERPELDRSRGLFQDTHLNDRGRNSILFAGAGSVGGWAAMVAAMDGHLHDSDVYIADGDRFEHHNRNRQYGADFESAKQKEYKAVVVARKILEIAPTARVEVIPEYLDEKTADEVFATGLNLVVDATDYDRPEIGAMLNKVARTFGVNDTMFWENGFAAMATTFTPEGLSYDDWFSHFTTAVVDAMPNLDDAGRQSADNCLALYPWTTYLPSYIHRDMYAKILTGEKKVPQIVGGALQGASLFSAELSGLLDAGSFVTPTIAPHVRYADAVDGEAGVVRDADQAAKLFWSGFKRMQLANESGILGQVWGSS